jgi:hypothetical protein
VGHRLGELSRRREAVRGHLLEGAQHRLLEVDGNRGPHRAQRRHHVEPVAGQDRLRIRPREGRLAHQHLVQYASQGVHVAPSVQLDLAARLLG